MKQCSHVRGYAAQFRGGGGMVGSIVLSLRRSYAAI
jgi:hypothetical protein